MRREKEGQKKSYGPEVWKNKKRREKNYRKEKLGKRLGASGVEKRGRGVQ